jgi:hypothetical protein
LVGLDCWIPLLVADIVPAKVFPQQLDGMMVSRDDSQPLYITGGGDICYSAEMIIHFE